jgi:hypothetical protein
MAEPFIMKLKGAAMAGLVVAGARVITGAGGAISSVSDAWGCAIAKTGGQTGRYTVTLARNAVKIAGVLATLVGPDSAALTTTKGVTICIRDNDVDPVAIVPGSALDGTFEVQWVQSNAGNADTEVQDNAYFYLLFFLIDTTVG